MHLKVYVEMLLESRIEFNVEYHDTLETTHIITESPITENNNTSVEATFSQSGKLVCIRGI